MYFALFAHNGETSGPNVELASAIGAPFVSAAMIGDYAPKSRGTITLDPADPTGNPILRLGFYTDTRDLDRMMAMYRNGWEVVHQSAFTSTVQRFALVDDRTVADDEGLAEMLYSTTFSRLCVLGGAAMGEDSSSVVDGHGRVRGVHGLRVADASIFPGVLRCPPALTIMMLGEHIVRLIRAEAE